MVRNFRFEEEGIALSGYPETPEQVDWLYGQGIRTVVSLHPVPPEVEARMKERGIEWRPFLVEDFGQGVPPGLADALAVLAERREGDAPTLVHCQGGGGRASTFYAALLVTQGLPVENAVVRLPALQKDAQRAFLHGFAAGLQTRKETRG